MTSKLCSRKKRELRTSPSDLSRYRRLRMMAEECAILRLIYPLLRYLPPSLGLSPVGYAFV